MYCATTNKGNFKKISYLMQYLRHHNRYYNDSIHLNRPIPSWMYSTPSCLSTEDKRREVIKHAIQVFSYGVYDTGKNKWVLEVASNCRKSFNELTEHEVISLDYFPYFETTKNSMYRFIGILTTLYNKGEVSVGSKDRDLILEFKRCVEYVMQRYRHEEKAYLSIYLRG